MEEENIQKTKTLARLIFLVGFTAIMLIMTTYAWFSTQKNVTLANLDGTVKVAEGLQISLDAKNWSNTIDFSKYNADQTTLKNIYGDVSGTGEHNIIPTEMLPVSTLGSEEIGTSNEMKFYRGTNTDQIKLGEIKQTSLTTTETGGGQVATTAVANPDIYPGYYAIDFFLENSSGTTTGDDVLKLVADSNVTVKASGNNSVGLENTPRVAFALMNTDLTATGASVAVGAEATTQASILAATTGTNSTIKDVAIWEPNAEKHVDYIVTNNNKVTWSSGDKTAYSIAATNLFTDNQRIPTYALKSTSVSKSFDNLYNWDGTVTDIAKQITLQTNSDNASNQTLVSVTTVESTVYLTPNGEAIEFKIPKAQVCRIRMYVWLEGQDVDCTNYASHGGGITVNVGLTKGDETTSSGGSDEPEEDPYLPTGFSHVEETSLENGYTIQDSTGNQYVWVEVPKTEEVYQTAGIEVTSFTEEEYTKIENDLHTYTSVYRDTYDTSYTDTWSSEEETGLTETEYYELKNKMLKSVYQHAGFYVGKYETGIENSYRTTADGSTVTEDELPITETPVIKQNAYVYDFVRCSQAQTLASSMQSGGYTTSLMFGVQWDLVMKHLENKGVTQAELNDDSTNWGNYANSQYSITNTNVKYNIYDIDTHIFEGYKSAPYNKTEEDNVLLTTGASETFSKMGIYDLAGNAIEWTLENRNNPNPTSAIRGGGCKDYGYYFPACGRTWDYGEDVSCWAWGFRVALY